MKEITLHFSSIKIDRHKKLVYLQDIRDKWLAQPLDLVFRMKAVCEQVPSSVESLNCNARCYHMKCYQISTKNLDRLQDVHFGSSISGKHHSPC